jgi:DNA adenine methylase
MAHPHLFTHGAARPFLKWAGGKRRLLPQLAAHFPADLHAGGITKYAEPFMGGGALFFHVASRFALEAIYLTDMNPELVVTYRTIQRAVEAVIERLVTLERRYLALPEAERKAFYYATRSTFNDARHGFDFATFSEAWLTRTCQLLFLNRTCYNGLFRVNRKGAFNVPFGRYRNPTICHADRLRHAARLLQNATIEHGDFTRCASFVDDQTLVYFDPPYRPISATAHFNSYAKQPFGDAEQLRLASFYRQLDARGARLMLSNSDPHNESADDDFFEDAYRGFRIERIAARRAINSNPQRRGAITELLILNYAS